MLEKTTFGLKARWMSHSVHFDYLHFIVQNQSYLMQYLLVIATPADVTIGAALRPISMRLN